MLIAVEELETQDDDPKYNSTQFLGLGPGPLYIMKESDTNETLDWKS